MRYLLLVWIAIPLGADITGCACEVNLEPKECSLCREADKQSAEPPIFFLKDNNPTKPNRWLALPRVHGKGGQPLEEMSPELRLQLWSVAIEKAKSLWGDDWGLAVNGKTARTQCHAHVHIGKLLDGMETSQFVVVENIADIPIPKNDGGIWLHPQGGKMHAHLGQEITETVLMR